jgi:hypothetical protein
MRVGRDMMAVCGARSPGSSAVGAGLRARTVVGWADGAGARCDRRVRARPRAIPRGRQQTRFATRPHGGLCTRPRSRLGANQERFEPAACGVHNVRENGLLRFLVDADDRKRHHRAGERLLIGGTTEGLGKTHPVQAFLVTGNPGSGKSMVAAELARRGFAALDPDYDPELSHWLGKDGRRADFADGPAAPTKAWLRSHRWVWSRPRLEELLTASGAPLFVCGIAVNQHELLDLFTCVFVLRIDDQTQEDRLVAHDRAHPRGRNEAGRQQIREGRPAFEAEMLLLGATPLNGTLPTRTVVDQILAHLPGV